MKKSKFSETQILNILKSVESGRTVKEVCREHGISDATFYNWRAKYGGLQPSDLKRLRELEQENARLKRMYADVSLDNQMLKELLTSQRKESLPHRWHQCVGLQIQAKRT